MDAGVDTSFVRASAERLIEAFEQGEPIEPLSDGRVELDIETAYAIQRSLVEMHAETSRHVVGRKIGLTSPAIQQQLGVGSPDYGVVLDSHVFRSGAVISRSATRMIAPRLEAELAFVLKRSLRGPGLSVQDVLDATQSIVPVFELIDSRIKDWRIRLEDTVADNASCFGVVRGDEIPVGELGDLTRIGVVLERDGVELEAGEGSAVLGHPAAAVAWLAEALDRFGEELPAGELILSGSFTAAIDAPAGHYRAAFGAPIGSVEVVLKA